MIYFSAIDEVLLQDAVEIRMGTQQRLTLRDIFVH
jgi:hypothetical protein